MPTIRSHGAWIRFEQEGDPSWPAVVLVHGFASSADDQWLKTGWVKRLHDAKRRSVRFDLRGHGRSERFYDPAHYSLDLLVDDLNEMLRYANARAVDLFGYSLGARLCLELVARKPARLRSLVLGGFGASVPGGLPDGEAILAALETSDASEITNPVARAFRAHAVSCGNELRALAAVQRGPGRALERASLAALGVPTFVFGGEHDTIAGDVPGMAALIPGARALVIPDADHLSAPAQPMAFRAVLGFLADVERAESR